MKDEKFLRYFTSYILGKRMRGEILTELLYLVKNACGKFYLKTEINWYWRWIWEETLELTIY